jgi:hypothetical protein
MVREAAQQVSCGAVPLKHLQSTELPRLLHAEHAFAIDKYHYFPQRKKLAVAKMPHLLLLKQPSSAEGGGADSYYVIF